ncbi:hypothetical protein ACG92U_09060 [Leuconostoc citreum]
MLRNEQTIKGALIMVEATTKKPVKKVLTPEEKAALQTQAEK